SRTRTISSCGRSAVISDSCNRRAAPARSFHHPSGRAPTTFAASTTSTCMGEAYGRRRIGPRTDPSAGSTHARDIEAAVAALARGRGGCTPPAVERAGPAGAATPAHRRHGGAHPGGPGGGDPCRTTTGAPSCRVLAKIGFTTTERTDV